MYVFGAGGGMYVFVDCDGLKLFGNIGFAILGRTLSSSRSAGAKENNLISLNSNQALCARLPTFFLEAWISFFMRKRIGFARSKPFFGIFCAKKIKLILFIRRKKCHSIKLLLLLTGRE